MLSFLVLNYNRPKETELCLKSIKQFTKFNHEVVLLNNGGEDHAAIFSFFNQGLIDKLVLRKKNSGCGLGTRELFNDFNLDNNYVVYVQCDQFMVRDFTIEEFNSYKQALDQNKSAAHVDLSGNQGNGRYSERAHLTSKKFYNSIPNSKGGPGPYANELWTEESIQNLQEKLPEIKKSNKNIPETLPETNTQPEISIQKEAQTDKVSANFAFSFLFQLFNISN